MEWMPIETAPKNGNPILLCHWEDEYCLVGEWWVQGWWTCGPFRYAPNREEIRDPVFIDFEPTHWMPLPPPPNVSQQDQPQPQHNAETDAPEVHGE